MYLTKKSKVFGTLAAYCTPELPNLTMVMKMLWRAGPKCGCSLLLLLLLFFCPTAPEKPYWFQMNWPGRTSSSGLSM